MALYNVYIRSGFPGTESLAHTPSAHDKVRLIRPGFSWLAFLFPVVWLLINRVWRWFLVILALQIGLAVLFQQFDLPDWSLLLASLLVMLYVGVSARDWLSTALERRGLRLIATNIAGENEDEAYAAFIRRPTPRSSMVADAKPAKPAESGPVIGLFPDPETRI